MRRIPTLPPARAALLALWSVAAVFSGCNDYDMLRRAGYQQESFSNRADLLFIVDNTDTMKEVSTELAAHFDIFIDRLQQQEEAISRGSLADAVDNYKGYVTDRDAYLDFQIGITTLDVEEDRGLLLGGERRILKREDPDLHAHFVETLLCEATCFREGVPSDPSYTCGDPIGDEVTAEYLDCVCGPNTWQDSQCASTGREEGLEAALLAMCAAVPNPPLDCFIEVPDHNNPGTTFAALLSDADRLANEGLVRPRSTVIPIIVTDEGDDSRREPLGQAMAETYQDLFSRFSSRMSFVVIGPPLTPTLARPAGCVGYHDWSAARYDYVVRSTDGLKIPIFDSDGTACPLTDVRSNLQQLGDVLANLLTTFSLQSVPDIDSLMVFVDGKRADPSEIIDIDVHGLPIYSDGWTYEPETNSVRFHGDAIPPNSAEVHVYYVPLDGMPRSLPF